MALPVTGLQRLLTLGETELEWLDTTINVKIYCCIWILIGPSYSVNCVYLETASRLTVTGLWRKQSWGKREKPTGPTLIFCLRVPPPLPEFPVPVSASIPSLSHQRQFHNRETCDNDCGNKNHTTVFFCLKYCRFFLICVMIFHQWPQP